MLPNGEGCYYLAVKKLAALLRGIKSKHGDFAWDCWFFEICQRNTTASMETFTEK